jgi:2-aminoadipate transaminase
MASLNPSAIREILKTTADIPVIAFSAGNPSPELFPAKELSELASETFAAEAASALQYGITEGYTPLRRQVTERMRVRYNIGSEDDDLIITSGGQQGIDLTTKCLVNEGDVVICEDPSFIGALNTFRS